MENETDAGREARLTKERERGRIRREREASRKKSDPEYAALLLQRSRANEARRKERRKSEPPEVREARLARERERRRIRDAALSPEDKKNRAAAKYARQKARMAEDHAYAEHVRERQRAKQAKRTARMHALKVNSPEEYKRIADEYQRRKNERYRTDPEYRANKNRYNRDWYAANPDKIKAYYKKSRENARRIREERIGIDRLADFVLGKVSVVSPLVAKEKRIRLTRNERDKRLKIENPEEYERRRIRGNERIKAWLDKNPEKKKEKQRRQAERRKERLRTDEEYRNHINEIARRRYHAVCKEERHARCVRKYQKQVSRRMTDPTYDAEVKRIRREKARARRSQLRLDKDAYELFLQKERSYRAKTRDRRISQWHERMSDTEYHAAYNAKQRAYYAKISELGDIRYRNRCNRNWLQWMEQKDKFASDPDAYAEYRRKYRKIHAIWWRKHHHDAGAYRPRISVRIPDWSTSGQDIFDRGSSFIRENLGVDDRFAVKAFSATTTSWANDAQGQKH